MYRSFRLTAHHLYQPPSPLLKATMATFNLPNTNPTVPVSLTPDLNQDQLLSFPAFNTWLSTLQHSLSLQRHGSHTFNSAPYHLRKIDIQSVDFFGGGRIGFIKLKADVSNDEGEKLPGSVFLRGGSVGMMVLQSSYFVVKTMLILVVIVDTPTRRRASKLRNRQTRHPHPSTSHTSRLTLSARAPSRYA